MRYTRSSSESLRDLTAAEGVALRLDLGAEAGTGTAEGLGTEAETGTAEDLGAETGTGFRLGMRKGGEEGRRSAEPSEAESKERRPVTLLALDRGAEESGWEAAAAAAATSR